MTRLAMWLVLAAACGDGAAVTDAAPGDVPGDAGADGPGDANACLAGAGDAAPAGPACTAGGVPGQCIDTAGCTGVRSPTPGLCAGPASVQCCTPRLAEGIACDPNAAPRPNECALVEEPGDPGCRPGMARVEAFCVDRFEASLVIDGEVRSSLSPYESPGVAEARAVSVRGAVPQGYVSQIQAGAACARAGKRLCTDAEWLRACRGAAARMFPYGDTRRPGACNDARARHPAVELYGTPATWIYAHLSSPCLNQLPDGLAPTGAHPDCVSEDGIYDLMGNLHEWTADPTGTFRGGFYVDTTLNGDGCAYRTTAHGVSHRDYSTGFRCCADADADATP